MSQYCLVSSLSLGHSIGLGWSVWAGHQSTTTTITVTTVQLVIGLGHWVINCPPSITNTITIMNNNQYQYPSPPPLGLAGSMFTIGSSITNQLIIPLTINNWPGSGSNHTNCPMGPSMGAVQLAGLGQWVNWLGWLGCSIGLAIGSAWVNTKVIGHQRPSGWVRLGSVQ